MNWKAIQKLLVLTMTASMLVVGNVSAEPAQQETAVAKTEPETSPEPEIRTLGQETEDAVKFEFVNGTDKAITWFWIGLDEGNDRETEEIIRMQEALIEKGFLDDVADGTFGPKTKAAVKAFREKNSLSADETVDAAMLSILYGEAYDGGNVLKEGETIAAGETVYVLYHPDVKKTETSEEDQSGFVTNEAYIASFKLAGEDETEYVLHTLPVEEVCIRIMVEDGIAYVEYQAAADEAVISTLESEKAILQPAPEPQETNNYNTYDDGYYDDGYYDDGYSYEPVYEESYYEPVYENDAQGADGCIDVDYADTY